MTIYKNFLKDFPARCLKILDMTWGKAQENDKEVTLSLMVASAGFVVPFELLRPPPEEPLSQPEPRKSYPTSSETLKELMEKKFWGSELYPKENSKWLAGKCDLKNGDLDGCEDLRKKKEMSDDRKVSNVLKGIRNALAHGNIHTTGDTKITLIVFITGSSKTKKNFIGVRPEEFLIFLRNWFKFVEEHGPSETEIENILGPAKD